VAAACLKQDVSVPLGRSLFGAIPHGAVCLERSGKKSPGFNTIPECEAPLTGLQGNIGDQSPLGFWDPAGFSKDQDVAKFIERHDVEIKHGRVSMLATIGYIVPEYFKFSGDGFFNLLDGIEWQFESMPLQRPESLPTQYVAQYDAALRDQEIAKSKFSASYWGALGHSGFGETRERQVVTSLG
jgi:hypothetical protein